MLNESIHYQNGRLHCDTIPIKNIVSQTGTPVYIYSEARVLSNLRRIQTAFNSLDVHVHYSAKANASLAILRTLVGAGAGIDAVSGGEIYRALLADVDPRRIVFAGVGKTTDELAYAIERGVGWFNVENIAELDVLNNLAEKRDSGAPQVALRLNPEVTANTHPYIATGHGGAKFGLTAAIIRDVLTQQARYPNLQFAGIHIHIGSQLGDTAATKDAIRAALELIAPYPAMRTVNIGGGLPVAYQPDDVVPDLDAFVAAIRPLLSDYTVLLEPGRSLIADAGILVAEVLYVKEQAGQTFVVTDASMTELIRPALYQARHEIVPVVEPTGTFRRATQIVGPVCETTDVLGRDVLLPEVATGDLLAVLTAGAYSMVMASNYNQRPRPPEVLVTNEGWQITRRRETWDDLLSAEVMS